MGIRQRKETRYSRGGGSGIRNYVRNNVGKLFRTIASDSAVQDLTQELKGVAKDTAMKTMMDTVQGKHLGDIVRERGRDLTSRGYNSIRKSAPQLKQLGKRLFNEEINDIGKELELSNNKIAKLAADTFFNTNNMKRKKNLLLLAGENDGEI